jgi:hypothetical protein
LHRTIFSGDFRSNGGLFSGIAGIGTMSGLGMLMSAVQVSSPALAALISAHGWTAPLGTQPMN